MDLEDIAAMIASQEEEEKSRSSSSHSLDPSRNINYSKWFREEREIRRKEIMIKSRTMITLI